jgi:hypothetical protein
MFMSACMKIMCVNMDNPTIAAAAFSQFPCIENTSLEEALFIIFIMLVG